MSHETPITDRGKYDDGARRHLAIIERVTGHAQITCPWRAMYQPIVMEVLAAMPFDENGNLALAIGNDPPRQLVDAISTYKIAAMATRNEESKLRAEKRKRERER